MIRIGTIDDYDEIHKLVIAQFFDSPYSGMALSEAKVRDIILDCLRTGVVLLSETGMIAGKVLMPPFSDETIAAEITWYSSCTGRKKILDESNLYHAFEYWAKYIAKAVFIQGSSLHNSKYFLKRNYKQAETAYLARIS